MIQFVRPVFLTKSTGLYSVKIPHEDRGIGTGILYRCSDENVRLPQIDNEKSPKGEPDPER
jgi:hypothetical protein